MIGKLALAAAATAGLLGLSACGTYGPTPYQSVSDGQGYAETQIEPGRYRISFKGNSLTDRETVENYMLYRAAELTLQQGFDTFTIANRDTDREDRVRQWGGYAGTRFSYAYFVPRYGWVGAWEPYWTPTRYDQVTRYDAFAEILMSRGPKGADPNAFSARDVSINLGPLISRAPQ